MEPSSAGTSTAPAQRGGSGHRSFAPRPDDRNRRPGLVALVEALGNLLRFVLLPGQRHDSVGVAPLLKHLAFAALLADKAFDTNAIRADVNERGARAVIPPKALGCVDIHRVAKTMPPR